MNSTWFATQHPASPERWFVQETVAGMSSDVCEMSNQNREQRAKMVAAAPDLFTAAVALVAAHEDLFARGLPLQQGGKDINHMALNEAARLASAAIAKASGADQ